nr:hypothetical protein GCM10010200_031580 [Actinomadura rugatobispora]
MRRRRPATLRNSAKTATPPRTPGSGGRRVRRGAPALAHTDAVEPRALPAKNRRAVLWTERARAMLGHDVHAITRDLRQAELVADQLQRMGGLA